jgi:hypothetical protein
MNQGKKRGIVFSIDAVFALYIALLLVAAFVTVIQVQGQTNEDLLKLSRLARDIHGIRQDNPGAALPTGFAEGSACDDAETVGSAFLLVYNNSADAVTVSSQRICISDV